jgi:excisionase family DNA binding protein
MLTITKAAEKLGLSPSTVRRLCDSGMLPFYRPTGESGHRRFAVEDLDSYLSTVKTSPKIETFEVKQSSFSGCCADVIARIRARTK